jgi:hypothetical protein
MTRTIHRIVAGRGRRLAVGLIAVLAATVGVVAPSTAANAAVLNMTILAHVCSDIGWTTAGIHGILCTDLASQPINGGTRVYGVTEAYCQNETGGGFVECADNVVWLAVYAIGFDTGFIYKYTCSGATTPCGVGRRYFISGQHFDIPTGSQLEMWAVTWGDAADNVQSSIDLPGPGGGRVKLQRNLGTQHVIVKG